MQRKQFSEPHAPFAEAHPDASPHAVHDRSDPHGATPLREREKAFAAAMAAARRRSGPSLADLGGRHATDAGCEHGWTGALDPFEVGRGDGDDGGRDDGDDRGDEPGGGDQGAGQPAPMGADVAGFGAAWADQDPGSSGSSAMQTIADPLARRACDRLMDAARRVSGTTKTTVRVPLGDGPLDGTDAVLTRDAGHLSVQIRAGSDDVRRRLVAHVDALRRRLAGIAPDCRVSVEVLEGGSDMRSAYA